MHTMWISGKMEGWSHQTWAVTSDYQASLKGNITRKKQSVHEKNTNANIAVHCFILLHISYPYKFVAGHSFQFLVPGYILDK